MAEEVWLGPACDTCGHGCVLDIAVTARAESAELALALEHKTVSGASDWKCADASCLGRQAAAYRRLFEAWAPRHRRAFVYLTPTGRAPDAEGWGTLSHDQLAGLLVRRLRSFSSRSRRVAAATFLVDLLGSHGDGFAEKVEVMRRWLREPEDFVAMRALADLSGDHPLIHLLEVFNDG